MSGRLMDPEAFPADPALPRLAMAGNQGERTARVLKALAARQVQELLGWARPALAAEVADIVGAIASGLGDAFSGPSHRDLNLDQILVDGARLGLIDLDAFAEGDPLTDPAAGLEPAPAAVQPVGDLVSSVLQPAVP